MSKKGKKKIVAQAPAHTPSQLEREGALLSSVLGNVSRNTADIAEQVAEGREESKRMAGALWDIAAVQSEQRVTLAEIRKIVGEGRPTSIKRCFATSCMHNSGPGRLCEAPFIFIGEDNKCATFMVKAAWDN